MNFYVGENSMAKERKIRCDCGNILIGEKTKFDNFETEAMVCPKCNFTTLTREQAEKYAKLKDLHSIIDAERKGICKSFKVELIG